MEIMGIVNVTPDSFSDGRQWASPDAAIAHGRELIAQGATILDIGGESTRPGAMMLTPDEEWARIADVVRELAQDVTLSVDTYHAATAAKAIEAGAHIVNDVTGGQADPTMFSTVASLGVPYILQHGRGNGQSMNSLAVYDGDLVTIVKSELSQQLALAKAAGIDDHNIILDPGLGFAKVGEQDWEVLSRWKEIDELGYPVLLGASRKRFLAATMTGEHIARDRDISTAVISGIAWENGAWGVRVHNVAATVSAVAVHQQLRKWER
ncbi:dihydropteroate synthase [Arcanobacterium canis]